MLYPAISSIYLSSKLPLPPESFRSKSLSFESDLYYLSYLKGELLFLFGNKINEFSTFYSSLNSLFNS